MIYVVLELLLLLLLLSPVLLLLFPPTRNVVRAITPPPPPPPQPPIGFEDAPEEAIEYMADLMQRRLDAHQHPMMTSSPPCFSRRLPPCGCGEHPHQQMLCRSPNQDQMPILKKRIMDNLLRAGIISDALHAEWMESDFFPPNFVWCSRGQPHPDEQWKIGRWLRLCNCPAGHQDWQDYRHTSPVAVPVAEEYRA
jgi:hypothetical protein